jgi:CrcB protein
MSASGVAAVGIGAALGAWLRWGLGAAMNALVPALPMGTLAANLIGGYLVGVAVAIFEQYGGLAPELRLFVITGFLGGLTTYSTFSAESVSLLTTGRYGWALAHTVAHLLGSISMTVLGITSVRVLQG